MCKVKCGTPVGQVCVLVCVRVCVCAYAVCVYVGNVSDMCEGFVCDLFMMCVNA